MSLKKIISVSLIAYVAVTILVVVYGLYIAPVRVAQTIPNPELQPPNSSSVSGVTSDTSSPTTDSTTSTTPTTTPTTTDRKSVV